MNNSQTDYYEYSPVAMTLDLIGSMKKDYAGFNPDNVILVIDLHEDIDEVLLSEYLGKDKYPNLRDIYHRLDYLSKCKVLAFIAGNPLKGTSLDIYSSYFIIYLNGRYIKVEYTEPFDSKIILDLLEAYSVNYILSKGE